MLAFNHPVLFPSDAFIHQICQSLTTPNVFCCRFATASYHPQLAGHYGTPLPATIARAVIRRQAEYLASRVTAKLALGALGYPDYMVTSAADRSPCWPAGVSASLSHATDITVVVATRQPLLVGIDVEQIMSACTAQETTAMLMHQQERGLLSALPLTWPQAATLLFSLKESLYKALWPQVRQMMDFHDCEVLAVDLSAGSALLMLRRTLDAHWRTGSTLQAWFTLNDREVITLVQDRKA